MAMRDPLKPVLQSGTARAPFARFGCEMEGRSVAKGRADSSNTSRPWSVRLRTPYANCLLKRPQHSLLKTVILEVFNILWIYGMRATGAG
eukprot:360774-Chlamydomonas_euryale.AAC.19